MQSPASPYPKQAPTRTPYTPRRAAPSRRASPGPSLHRPPSHTDHQHRPPNPTKLNRCGLDCRAVPSASAPRLAQPCSRASCAASPRFIFPIRPIGTPRPTTSGPPRERAQRADGSDAGRPGCRRLLVRERRGRQRYCDQGARAKRPDCAAGSVRGRVEGLLRLSVRPRLALELQSPPPTPPPAPPIFRAPPILRPRRL